MKSLGKTNKRPNEVIVPKNRQPKTIENQRKKYYQCRFQRQYPIGKRELELLLKSEPHIIPVTLLIDSSGYQLLLDVPTIEKDTLGLVIKILHKSLDTKVFADGTKDLILLTFTNSRFLQNITRFVSNAKYEVKLLFEYLPLLCEIIDCFLTLSPINAFPVASGFVDTCVGVITHINPENKSDMESVEKYLQTLQLKIKESRASYERFKTKPRDAPNNFRELDVVPTNAELNAIARPFIRPNIIEGGYENSDHYLDIHFRLLKEDFIRPLREGLQHYRNDYSKVSDVRVYSNVTLHSTNIEKSEFVHYIRINTNKKVLLNNSKRFMFGNIICMSDDNFDTVITASVFNKDGLDENLIGIKIEAEYFIHYDKTYVAIESKAFFTPYKHALIALQNLKHIPFENYIVFVNEVDKEPQYLLEDGLHHLPEISKANNLDESQQRALNAALSRQVAIIQGPPGTGKTFLGLKITEILLRNKRLWCKGDSRPILAVCYTNHALDQFLEGITNFTTNIVRIGSRSKSKIVQQYTIKNRFSATKRTENFARVTRMFDDIKLKIRNCHFQIHKITRLINILGDFSVLDLFSYIEKYNIVPSRLAIELKKLDTVKFLREKFIYRHNNYDTDMKKASKISSVKNRNAKHDLPISPEDELMKEEENERKLDDYELNDNDINENEEYNYDDDDKAGDDKLPDFKTLLNYSELNKMLNDLYDSKDVTFRQIKIKERKIMIDLEILKRIYEMEVNESESKALENVGNIYDLTFDERAKLYCLCRNKLRTEFGKLKQKTESKLMSLHKRLLSLRNLEYLSIMNEADIVGMTTTAAAQYFDLLHDLAPPIVIVEEAAEILEAHVISSLSSKCQHLIMIGDHQQLRPKTNVYELSKKCHLDMSLFERLIKNNIKYETLECQHRMKPVISELLVPTFYENLKDHPSVLKYPKIRGVKEDLFFINHSKHEKKPSSDYESFENLHEAQFLLGLCRHLMYQGYTEKDITIITPYSGQFRCLRELQKEEPLLGNIPINILDDFQGEESNIIFLSLVRSNEEGNVGFMKIDNRICVAISRAKHGMYIIGNMNQMIESSSIWSKINQKLEDKKHIGYNLHLTCLNHPEVSITVNDYEEFALKSPEGGCNQMCPKVFPQCGHACPRHCHPDDLSHTLAKCKVPCPKFLCEFNHIECNKLCYEDCPKCSAPVEKEFACGHKHIVKCYQNPNTIKCPTIIDKVLPCEHIAKNIQCHIDVNSYLCKEVCLKILTCGHHCKKKCHKFKCKEHYLNVKSFFWKRCMEKDNEVCEECQMLVEKKLACGHKLMVKCSLNLNEFKCYKVVDKILACNHVAKNVQCHYDVKQHSCTDSCLKILSCGHLCKKRCHKSKCKKHYLNAKSCTSERCFEENYEVCPDCPILVVKKLECGHKHRVKCSLNPEDFECPTIVDKVLPCNHVARNIQCHVDVKHLTCTGRCLKILNCGHHCKEKCHKSKCKNHYRNTKSCTSENCFQKDFEVCPDCQMLVEKQLPCGHKHEMKCNMDPKDFVCCQKVDKNLPCGHKINIECNVDVTSLKCLEPCSEILTCGHVCDELCSRITDPDHKNYSCKRECLKFPSSCNFHKCKKLCYEECGSCTEIIDRNLECGHVMKGMCGSTVDQINCLGKCQRILPCGHPCPRKCGEKCGECKALVSKVKQTCGHTVSGVPCDSTEAEIKCQEQCNKILPCNHICPKLCGEMCGGCTVPVEKIIPECLHSAMVRCEDTPLLLFQQCRNRCRKHLPCGHLCQNLCKDLCTVNCAMMVTSNQTCPRGHNTKRNIPCYDFQFNFTLEDFSLNDYKMNKCMEVCGLTLECHHKCKGKCGQCLSGRLHLPCTHPCNKILACGHKCKAPCAVECPPCKEICMWKCVHKECKKRCGDRYSTICNKKCPCACVHSSCSAKCGIKCSRDPCYLPCKRKIAKCRHQCIGFCGEPCPFLCRICDKDKVQELLFGHVTINNARFIALADCKHVFESNFLDKWMYTKSSKGVNMKMCPECQVPIYNTRRYQSLILDIYKEISRRTLQTRKVNTEWFKRELLNLVTSWPNEVTIIKERLGFDDNFSVGSKKQPMVDASLLDLCYFQVNILKFASSIKGKSRIKNELKIFINLVMTYEGKMTPEKRDQFFYELRRLKNCDRLINMRDRPLETQVKNVVKIIEDIEKLMHPTVIFSNEIENQVRGLFDEGWGIINLSRRDRHNENRKVRSYYHNYGKHLRKGN